MAVHDILQPVDFVDTTINIFFDNLISCLNERRLVLLNKARDARHEMAGRPTTLARIEQELIVAKTDIGGRLKMNELQKTQEKLIKELDEKLIEVRKPLPVTRLVFRGEFKQLEQLILVVGDVVEEEVTTIPRYEDLGKIWEVGKKGQAPGELSNPRGVAIDENTNNIYVTEEFPTRVSVFSKNGEFLNSFTHQHILEPWGIAISKNNMYVTDTGVHGVFHFNIAEDIRLDSALVGRGSHDGKFNSPRQLAISASGDVFVADFYNHKIQILDQSLHSKRSIKHPLLNKPSDVKLTINEIFILSCNPSCVHVFSQAGEKIRSFITRGQGMEVKRACFFCLDAQKNVIISDCGDSSVKIFSPNGTLLRVIEGFQDGIYSTLGLALTNQLKLVVIAPHDTFMLQIFS